MESNNPSKPKENSGLAFKIIYLAGLIVSGCALFMPAKEGDILAKQNVANLFQAFTGKNPDGIQYVNMLFGHSAEDPIGISGILLEILISFLPAALLIATAVIIFVSSRKLIGLVFGLVGAVTLLGRNMFLALTDTGFFGVYMGMAGMIIAILGLLLLYIGKEEGEYVIAGVIECRTGTFAGNSFEVADQVVIGKDPNRCNIVLNNRTISRVHCIIRYLEDTDSYTVKDVSSNGTYLGDGRRFAKNYEAHVERGTEIYMGDPRETFYLD